MADDSFAGAFRLLITFNPELYFVIYTSLKYAFFSTVFASLFSIPAACAISLNNFKGKKIIISLINSLMALPTVVIGLFVYALICRKGILGDAGLLFTGKGVILAQTILAFPIICSMLCNAIAHTDIRLIETLKTFKTTRIKSIAMILNESRRPVTSSILTGFSRVIGEVGVAMMIGGNIRWETRTITTAIALETGKGNFSLSAALGIMLIVIAIIINFGIHKLVKDE